MIKLTKGNILQSKAEALVNTVNTIGVMGKGIALLFKESFENNYLLYHKACKNGEVQIGKMFITETNNLTNPKYIINFPTKQDWRAKSEYDYIEKGLADFIKQIQALDIQSVAIPALGAGNGGLDWTIVRPMIEKALEFLPTVQIELYEPADIMPEKKKSPIQKGLTPAGAMILALLNQYGELGYRASLLEMQKLAYFLQAEGEPLKLNFKPHYYGMYADNLRKFLETLEGDFLLTEKRIADSKPLDYVALNEAKLEEVKNYIQINCTAEQKERLAKVAKIIRGFESPLGMELLSTTHWVMATKSADTPQKAQALIYQWEKNPQRKRALMLPNMIEKAFAKLIES
jgi:O-acetyl-ADP-ribose deacetylase (regulator of RNase III)/uncharacterized protein YwgA